MDDQGWPMTHSIEVDLIYMLHLTCLMFNPLNPKQCLVIFSTLLSRFSFHCDIKSSAFSGSSTDMSRSRENLMMSVVTYNQVIKIGEKRLFCFQNWEVNFVTVGDGRIFTLLLFFLYNLVSSNVFFDLKFRFSCFYTKVILTYDNFKHRLDHCPNESAGYRGLPSWKSVDFFPSFCSFFPWKTV